jgi:peptidoglycan/LPS O-acetylase OafA/YrhL
MKQQKNPHESNRIYGLDVFRALAVLFVLIGHSFEHSNVISQLKTYGHLGILGVELFFVLSGFLIGSIIMKKISENQFHSFSNILLFWKQRWLRTIPMYIVTLLAFIRFDYHGRHELLDYPTYYVFMQNFAYEIPEFFELSWSLAIEEHFYFWFPIIFLIWQRFTKKSHISLILTSITFIAIAYFYRIYHPQYSDWNNYNRAIRLTVLSRIDAIMFGVLIASAKHYWMSGFEWIKKATPITATIFILLCSWWFIDAPGLMQSRFWQINLYTAQALLCALLLPWFCTLQNSGIKNGFFETTSKLSYSLYLTHILVIIFTNKALGHFGLFDMTYSNPFVIYPIYFSLYYLISWLTFNSIEKPFLNLRNVPMTSKNIIKAAWPTIIVCLTLIFKF